MVLGQSVKLRGNFFKLKAQALGKHDVGHPPQAGAPVAAVARTAAHGFDQAQRFVVPQCGGVDPAALRNHADGQQLIIPRIHGGNPFFN
ncbi:hypothetical protein D3C71_1428760 [compost metagenome]